MTPSNGTIYVVDDDASTRTSLTRLLRLEDYDVEVFPSTEMFLDHKKYKRPACLISDIRMPGLSGLDLQRVCLERKIPIPIIFITGHGEIPMSVQAMKNGAADFLPKPYSPDDLLRAVRESIERDRTSSVHEHSVNRVQNRIDTLSAREKEVLGGVTAGMLNKQIAYKLGITEKTVKVHRANVMLKMKATSVPDLVRLAELANLASPSLD